MHLIRALVALSILGAVSLSPAQTQRGHHFSRPPAGAKPSSPIPDLAHDTCYRQLVSNQRVRVFRVEVAPHQSTLVNHHEYDYVLVSLGANHMMVEGGGAQARFDLQDGEMQVLQGGWTHRVTNLGETPLRFVEIDVRPRIDPGHALCGLAGEHCSDGRFGRTEQGGDYSYSTLFETSTVKLRKIEVDAGVTVPGYSVAGEALVLALTDSDLGPATHLEAGTALWHGKEPGFGVTNSGKTTVRLLVVELK